jgi:hypothetical protein
VPRPLLCPICKSAVHEFDRTTRDATGFDCETHGKFKVANTVFKDDRVKNCVRAQGKVRCARHRRERRRGHGPL